MRVKWMTLDNSEGTQALKQHAFQAVMCQERYMNEKYPGNRIVCRSGFASEDGELAQDWEFIEGEMLDPAKACKKCLKLLKIPEK